MPVFSQSEEAMMAMQKLQFMEGIWKGEGWTLQGGNGKQLPFKETETVSIKLNGLSVVVEAFGISSKDSSVVVVNALAVMAYDVVRKKYLMRLTDMDGSTVDTYLKITDTQSLEWGIPDVIKFTIAVKDDLWVETGYKKTGTNWTKTFEMHLKKR
jgi:hypothetical protein